MKKSAFAALLIVMMGAGAAYADFGTQAVSVPDGGMTVGLLAGAMLGLGVLRSKFRR